MTGTFSLLESHLSFLRPVPDGTQRVCRGRQTQNTLQGFVSSCQDHVFEGFFQYSTRFGKHLSTTLQSLLVSPVHKLEGLCQTPPRPEGPTRPPVRTGRARLRKRHLDRQPEERPGRTSFPKTEPRSDDNPTQRIRRCTRGPGVSIWDLNLRAKTFSFQLTPGLS